MPRQKLSEFKSKKIIFSAIGIEYEGYDIHVEDPANINVPELDSSSLYVVKVDQGVKGRFKKGLVALDVSKSDIKQKLSELNEKGYDSFIVEPQFSHEQSEERYLAVTYSKDGMHISCSEKGGIDIESNKDSIRVFEVDDNIDWSDVSKGAGLSIEQLQSIVSLVKENFITLLEINPYVLKEGSVLPLDAAIEVDDSGSYFVDTWSHSDFRRSSSRKLTEEEVLVGELDENSPASLKLEVLNQDGSIFLLLSGGGASVVIADEIYNLGKGKELANYGEYSGNPNTEETYLYTKSLLQLLVNSKADKKVLFIGGAVANFTDIANTFRGIIQAIDEMNAELSRQGVKIFVRRGGPRQEIGLKKIEDTLSKYGLMGAVYDPTTPLTKAVANAVEAIK